LLLRRWAKAKTGEGQVVLLSGEAGIGKSRLIVALLERLGTEPHARLRYFCSPHHTDSAFHPIIVQLERAAGFAHGDTPEAKLDKLAALLAPASPPQEDGALLANLLSLSTEGRFPPLPLPPQRNKEKTFEALLQQLDTLAQQRPVLMLFEDVHWIDPSSRELLDLILERVPRLPVLLVVTVRPEFQSPWTGQAHVTLLTVNRLDRRESAALVRRVVDTGTLPSDVIEEIAERTDGVPLFVEELTRAVLEAGDGRPGTTLSRASATALTVPATLHASLIARLDRLGPAGKEIAQVGAALGREFAFELLAAVARRNAVELENALDHLVTAGLVFRRGTPPQATFLFKHALVQDAAYGTLLRGKRRELHRRVADVLEERWPERAAAQPELLAYHCAQAGLVERAIAYYVRAGQRAVARSAVAEAIAQLTKGLELLKSLPDDATRQQQELDLRIILGQALIVTKGYAAAEVGETYACALALCERLGHPPKSAPVLFGQWVHHLIKGELRRARLLATEMLQRGEDSGDNAVTVTGHRQNAVTCFHLGELSVARAHLEQGIAMFDPADRPFYASLSLQDPCVTLLTYLSHDLFCLGYLDQSRVRSEGAIKEARQLQQAYSIAHSLSQACWVDWAARSRAELQRRTDAAIAFSAEHGFPYNRAVSTVFRGWALAASGQTTEGIALLCDGLAAYRATRAAVYVPFFLMLLADAQGKAQQPGQALAHLAQAESLMAETEERWAEAELYRIRGELLCVGRDHTAAERCFCQAIGIAQQRDAKFWELRAATSLARLWRDQGKREEAYTLLAPVYGWFTEGFDTRDLKEAKALLDELS
jgi:predicted ATPase